MVMSTEKSMRLLEQKLKEISDKDFIPAPLVDLLKKVYTIQIEARAKAEIVVPAREELASDDMRVQGAPLMDRDTFPLDMNQVNALVQELIGVLETTTEPLKSAGKTVADALESGELKVEEAVANFLHGDEAFFAEWAEKTPNAPKTLNFIIQAAVMPSAAAAGEQLGAMIRPEEAEKEVPWRHGHCPVCGSLPLMAELKGKEGRRILTCSFCQHEYRVPRLSCVFCGEDDAQKLPFFTVEEVPGYRVDACKSCNLYIKTTDFRQFDRSSLPMMNDLESLAMDILATEEKFQRPTPSGWGF